MDTVLLRFKIPDLRVIVVISGFVVPIANIELPPIKNAGLSVERYIFDTFSGKETLPVHFEKSPVI